MPSPAAKSPKRRSNSQRKETSPSVSDLILRAASASATRGGVSLAALRKALESGGYDVKRNRARILLAVKRLVANKSLVQTKGTGVTGSFRLSKEPPAPQKKRAKKKPEAKRGKRVRAVRAAAAAGAAAAAPVVKKSPKKKKAKSLKTPKRAVMSTRSRAAAKEGKLP